MSSKKMEQILQIKNIKKNFNGLVAVDNFSFSIKKGNIVGLIGPNGAGKTTVFNIIMGFLSADYGKVLYKNKDITRLSPHKINLAGIARTFQDLRLISQLTVLDNVILARCNQPGESVLVTIFNRKKMNFEEEKNKNIALDILDFVGLKDHQSEFASNLSYGQQKLLSIACCFSTDAELLLLDEPVSGLYMDMIEKVSNLMKKLIQKGKTILLIEHDIEAVIKLCDFAIVMDHGQKITEGPPSIIMTSQNILEAYLE